MTTDESRSSNRMDVTCAIGTLVSHRRSNQVVITNQGSAREWPKQCTHPLDFHYIPSAMGAAIPLGLGIAIAQPHREVVVLSGDGSLLMNLGCLVTVVASEVTNLSIVLFDNGVYEVTGGQKTAASLCHTDFFGLARAAGFPNVTHCCDAEDWSNRAPDAFLKPGPRFAWLEVEPVSEDYLLDPPCPIVEQLERLQVALKSA
jgi:sulfopyruvate decarboxylase subunit beta